MHFNVEVTFILIYNLYFSLKINVFWGSSYQSCLIIVVNLSIDLKIIDIVNQKKKKIIDIMGPFGLSLLLLKLKIEN